MLGKFTAMQTDYHQDLFGGRLIRNICLRLAVIFLGSCGVSGLQGQCGGDWALAQWSPQDAGDPYSANTPFQLAADDWGNTYMAGYASDSLFLQSSDGNYYYQGSGNDGRYQLVLSKYDREGALLWKRSFPVSDVGAFFSPDVAVWDDRVAICGTYFQAPGPLPAYIGSFVTMLDSAGVELWTLEFPGKGVMESYGISFFPTGELALTGKFTGEFEIPGGWTLACGPPPDGVFIYNSEIFALKLSPEGQVIWAVQSGSAGEAPLYFHRGQPIAVDDSGDVVIGGYYEGRLKWGALETWSGREGGRAPFVVKLDGATGAAQWLSGAETIDGAYPNGALYGLVCDRSRNIYGVGYIQSEFEWDGWSLAPKGYFENLLVCFDEEGRMKWARTFGSADPEDREWAATAMISPYNTLVVGANIFPGTFIDDGILDFFGKGDVAALEFDLSGAYLRGWTFGGPDTDFSYGGVFDREGSLLFCGNSLSGRMDFGDTELEFNTDQRTNSFLFKRCLSQPDPGRPEDENGVRVFPNPGKSVFWVEGNFGSGQLEAVIANVLGQEQARQAIPLFGERAVYAVNAGTLPPGVYYLLLSRDGQALFSVPVLIGE